MDNPELLSWSVLYTIGGASLVTYHVVQYTKHLIKDVKWLSWLTIQLYAAFVAALVLVAATAVVQDLTWSSGLLAVFNAFIVAYVSGKQRDDAYNEGLSASNSQ